VIKGCKHAGSILSRGRMERAHEARAAVQPWRVYAIKKDGKPYASPMEDYHGFEKTHATEADALAEAARLAEMNPGRRFVAVMKE